MDSSEGNHFNSQTTTNILSGVANTDNMSISEISALIREQHEKGKNREEKFGHFVLSASGPLTESYSEPTVTYAKKQQ